MANCPPRNPFITHFVAKYCLTAEKVVKIIHQTFTNREVTGFLHCSKEVHDSLSTYFTTNVSNLHEGSSVEAMEETFAIVAPVRIYFKEPRNGEYIGALIRQQFYVSRFTESLSYYELKEQAPQAQKSCDGLYDVRLNASDKELGSADTWQFHIRIQVISVPPSATRIWSDETEVEATFAIYWEDLKQRQINDSTGNLQRLLEQNIKPKEAIQDIHQIIDEWAGERDNYAWFRNQSQGPNNILATFLKAHNRYNRQDLIEILEECLASSNEATFENLRRQYYPEDPDEEISKTIFLLDRLLLGDSWPDSAPSGFATVAHGTALNRSEANNYKLRVIRSIFVLLKKLFPCDYEDSFIKIEDMSFLENAMRWVSMRRPGENVTNDNDTKVLRGLWDWFNRSQCRRIGLSLKLSMNGMLKETNAKEIIDAYLQALDF